jgi:SagB-type dehydrogenase family enzyme
MMFSPRAALAVTIAFGVLVANCGDVADNMAGDPTPSYSSPPTDYVELPAPRGAGPLSLEETLALRRSEREYASEPLSQEAISQLLWAAQGVTSATGGRTAPSAGGLYPLELYLLTGQGVFHYFPGGHRLAHIAAGDLRESVAVAGLGQDALFEAAAVIVITAVFERTAGKYGERAERYVLLEAGHCAQNVLLQAVALGLGAVPIGAFHDAELASVLDLHADHEPLYLIPIGRPDVQHDW